MPIKLFDAELKVMEVLWREGDQTAAHLTKIMNKETGWIRNTTYTVIKKLVEKGAVERREPNFVCHAAVTKEEVQCSEAEELIDKLFGGSAQLFLSAYVSNKKLSADEIDGLRRIVDELK